MKKNFLLKLFSERELWQEILRRQAVIPPDETKKTKEESVFVGIKSHYPEFLDLLKIRKYNLSNQMFLSGSVEEINFINGQRTENEYWIKRIEGSTITIQEKEKQQEREDYFKKITEGLKKIKEKITLKKENG
jgi:hypothetical protein